ncbi:Rap1 GTPase-activating protein 2 [Exaiptasia diaphana]|nr:Rap1 GTPase-activating protein 2 [Exaiptasia diaphana]
MSHPASDRLDEQRCDPPTVLINNVSEDSHSEEEFIDGITMPEEHLNFMCDDERLGPTILSIKQEKSPEVDSQGFIRVILRTSEKTIADLLPIENLSENYGPREIIKYLLGDEIEAFDQFQVVAYPRASELVVKFDEHMSLPAFKFGIIYQQFGQITEEEYFNNKTHGSAMNEFLDILGARVCLKDFQGYFTVNLLYRVNFI